MRTLLLADDSVTVQRVIALTFADEQVQVVTASDGRQAMEKMAALTPDIVLAGTTLPHVNGYDLASFMRSKPALAGVPVLLMTGAFEVVDEARLVSSGASGVIEKPVEPTIVISRVKELLGLKSDAKPAAAGRLITSPEPPAERRPVATPPRAVTSTRGTPSRWEQLRDQSGLEANARSVEDSTSRPDDYLDTLDAAFDTLDQQLSGRTPRAKNSRNPSPPLGPSARGGDPRSPGRRPEPGGAHGEAIFEVDDEWFGAGAGAGNLQRRDAAAAPSEREPEIPLQAPAAAAPTAANPVFEVDDEWFAEDDKARAAKAIEQRVLAAEMGIHEVELPPAPPRPATAPMDLDLDFKIEDLPPQKTNGPAPVPTPPSAAVAPLAPAKPLTAAAIPVAPPAPMAAPKPMPPLVPSAPVASAPEAPGSMADDFAALLAYEQGEHQVAPVAPVPAALATAPPPAAQRLQLTDDVLDQIAGRVAERLQTGAVGERLRDTIRDTVRTVVSETSERLVREEIERIKSKKPPQA